MVCLNSWKLRKGQLEAQVLSGDDPPPAFEMCEQAVPSRPRTNFAECDSLQCVFNNLIGRFT